MTSVEATLASWRESGADRVDPVRFRFIEALARRASQHQGPARRRLEARLAQLLDDYRLGLEAGGAPQPSDPPRRASPGVLSQLLGHMASQPRAPGQGPDPRASYPESVWLDDFRKTWARLSADRQLRHSQEQVPDNAGPLNSSHLVHRSLSLMREVSPAYLQHFLSYVDALAWLEPLQDALAPAPRETPRAAPRKSPRGKPAR
ncbi:DUF2894 domain-containing protein [Bordetella sp. 2513F-2]